ncbi:diacylglycerol/lipid kinase family protein [Tengunoibacter tsumagoiensis]|uniref:DAGKc domain-containing protein n=1 Tax=Tengunoibacter tsumagoiensis TaxID=2014871 RepID=A0A401ZZS5_9CHLR|nr:diacylglycerol kinase family protein [Tengunoibacter tsumagoiensis]GCE12336.1 hypothetical protein KTT_21950 [Tengunoibacter tsumagoiensis]
MRVKKASLLVNPRAGENVVKLPDVLAVLAAAGWKTEIALKEYGKHIIGLANKASQGKADLIIAQGGDGTLNQVVNGVMSVPKSRRSVVGILPGGTANVWAGEIGVPIEPVKAALALVNSKERSVDVGRLEIHSIQFPGEEARPVTGGNKKKIQKESKEIRHHFLLMAGIGIDAAIMGNVSKPLKYRVGPLAVGVSALKELPAHHTFPIEIQSVGAESTGDLLWKGEALQVVIGNTRSYAKANSIELTPDAYIDDGLLDVCVITAGDPLTTIQQISSLLLRQRPSNTSAEFFHGAHLQIKVPASISFHLDGSAVKLKDYLSKADYERLEQLEDASQVMVTYQFDAVPHALTVAIPQTYTNELFENGDEKHEHKGIVEAKQQHEHQPEGKLPETTMQHETEATETQSEPKESQHDESLRKELPDFVDSLVKNGRKVTVIAKTVNPEKKETYILAGSVHKDNTGEDVPVAVVLDAETTLFDHQGKSLKDIKTAIDSLQEGTLIIVEGSKSKRGVITARRAVL